MSDVDMLLMRGLTCALMILTGCVPFPEPNPYADSSAGAPAATAPAPAASALSEGVIHRVQRGDTLYSLAERFRIPVRSIIDLNRLRPPYRLIPGQPLLIPKPREHRVVAGDTVYGISRRYGVDMSALVKLNGIAPPYTIKVSQIMRLPAPVETQDLTVAAVSSPEPAPAASLTHAPGSPDASGPSGVLVEELLPAGAAPPGGTEPPPSPSAAPSVASAPPPNPATSVAGIVPAPRSSSRFLWPVEGKILSGFGPKKGGLHNDGINIAAAQGTPVRAAENGVVAYAGNELRGFGNLLLIKHADGWTSAYAHNEELLVRRGDRVERGQIIAKVGSSGSVTSPQLHFELRDGARAVDPVRLLSRAEAGL
ncbi:MAG TPA: LysM peptidoglycan-binding domain-containing M23 family metallopeptidase [Alphaproteobacteria bacterium]|nr:LysM peptidoglycan-binding domain-containing M23 family metallopeptidase [Alphaproteobacteria bacterium]